MQHIIYMVYGIQGSLSHPESKDLIVCSHNKEKIDLIYNYLLNLLFIEDIAYFGNYNSIEAYSLVRDYLIEIYNMTGLKNISGYSSFKLEEYYLYR